MADRLPGLGRGQRKAKPIPKDLIGGKLGDNRQDL
jgi:hypothetical protein